MRRAHLDDDRRHLREELRARPSSAGCSATRSRRSHGQLLRGAASSCFADEAGCERGHHMGSQGGGDRRPSPARPSQSSHDTTRLRPTLLCGAPWRSGRGAVLPPEAQRRLRRRSIPGSEPRSRCSCSEVVLIRWRRSEMGSGPRAAVAGCDGSGSATCSPSWMPLAQRCRTRSRPRHCGAGSGPLAAQTGVMAGGHPEPIIRRAEALGAEGADQRQAAEELVRTSAGRREPLESARDHLSPSRHR